MSTMLGLFTTRPKEDDRSVSIPAAVTTLSSGVNSQGNRYTNYSDGSYKYENSDGTTYQSPPGASGHKAGNGSSSTLASSSYYSRRDNAGPEVFKQKPLHLDKVAVASTKSNTPVASTVAGKKECLKRTGRGLREDVNLVLTLGSTTQAEIAAAIGYKYNPDNGGRDVESFLSGRCKEVERRTNLFYSTYFEDDGTPLVSVPKSTDRCQNFQEYNAKAGNTPTSGSRVVATQAQAPLHLTQHDPQAKTIAGKKSNLKQTGQGLAADVALVQGTGVSDSDIAAAIGYKYSTANGPRDVKSFLSGRCKELGRRESLFYETYFGSATTNTPALTAGGGRNAPVVASPARGASVSTTSSAQDRLCAVCFAKEKSVCFVPCGHQSCAGCSTQLASCHLCRVTIAQKIVLH